MKKGLLASAPLLSAALVGAAVAWPTVASARDEVRLHPKLNGRINELEQELRIMKNRMKAVERRRAGRKSPGAYIKRKNKKVAVTVYGQVNRMVLFSTQKGDSDFLHLDNDVSSSRIGIEAKGKLGGGWRVRAKIEFELDSLSSANRDDSDFTGDRGQINIRKVEIRIRKKRLGSLTFGQTSMATDGLMEIDLSGTKLAAHSDVRDFGGGVHLRLNGLRLSQEVREVFDNLDGTRADGIRYDSPKFWGLWFSVSHAADRASLAGNDGNANVNSIDLAIRYVGTIGGFKIAGGGGARLLPGPGAGDANGNHRTTILGSISIFHKPTGVSLTFAGSARKIDAIDAVGFGNSGAANGVQPRRFYIKLAWKGEIFSIGSTAVSVDYFKGRDTTDNLTAVVLPNGRTLFAGGEGGDWHGQSIGFAVVQKVSTSGLEVYGGYRYFRTKVNGQKLDAIHNMFVGARQKF